MAWREKALTATILAVVFLSLTVAPTWSMAFLILFGMIAPAVDAAVKKMRRNPILPVSAPASALAPAPAPAVAVDDPVVAVDAAGEIRRNYAHLSNRRQRSTGRQTLPISDPAPGGHAFVVDDWAPPLDASAPRDDVPAPAPDVDASALADDPAVKKMTRKPILPVYAPYPALAIDAPVLAANAAGRKKRRKPKLVMKLDLHDDKDWSKAVQAVFDFGGIGSLTMDRKDNKLMVSGDFDPIKVVNRLRKSWHTEIVSVGPAKEDDGKKDEGKKNEDQIANFVKAYEAYYPQPLTYY